MSLIERLKLESELKSTVSIDKLFQRFMTRSAKKLDLTVIAEVFKNLIYKERCRRTILSEDKTNCSGRLCFSSRAGEPNLTQSP